MAKKGFSKHFDRFKVINHFFFLLLFLPSCSLKIAHFLSAKQVFTSVVLLLR